MLAVISTIAFLMLCAGSGDVARHTLGQQATQDPVLAKDHDFGLDQPVLTQFTTELSRAVTVDVGASWFDGQDVTAAMARVMGATLLNSDARSAER